MTNAEVARRPVLNNGLLCVTNANDIVLAIEPATGKLVWQQHRTPAMGWRSRATPGCSCSTTSGARTPTGTELVHDAVGGPGDQLRGHVSAVQLAQVLLDVSGRHPAGVEGDHPLVEALEPALCFLTS